MLETKIALLVSGMLCSLQSVLQPTEKQQAQKALTQLLQGIADHNMPMIRAYATPDCLILEDGHLYNLDSIEKHMAHAKQVASQRINHLYIATTRIENNTAWLAFTDITVVTENGKTTTDNFLESAYLVKVANVWKVHMIHSTTVTSYQK